jgi:aldose 1-epimerase
MAFETAVMGEKENTSISLVDKKTGTRSIIFAFGALLNEFSILKENETLNVIDGFASTGDAILNITNAFKSARLSPFVCRLKNGKYHFGANDFHIDKFSLGKHAIHGLIYDAVFSVTETTADENHAGVTLQYVYNTDNDGYPFTYRCEICYKLEADNKLTLATTITNIDEQLIPVCDGWHPYFALGNSINECQLEFQSNEMVDFDSELIPTGRLRAYEEFGSLSFINETELDNCFTVNFAECQPMCVFRNPQKNVQVEIHPAESYPYLQIYTPPHRNSLAIENLSAAPDAFNNAMGLHVLEPGESKNFSSSYIIKSW